MHVFAVGLFEGFLCLVVLATECVRLTVLSRHDSRFMEAEEALSAAATLIQSLQQDVVTVSDSVDRVTKQSAELVFEQQSAAAAGALSLSQQQPLHQHHQHSRSDSGVDLDSSSARAGAGSSSAADDHDSEHRDVFASRDEALSSNDAVAGCSSPLPISSTAIGLAHSRARHLRSAAEGDSQVLSRWKAERAIQAVIERLDLIKADVAVRAIRPCNTLLPRRSWFSLSLKPGSLLISLFAGAVSPSARRVCRWTGVQCRRCGRARSAAGQGRSAAVERSGDHDYTHRRAAKPVAETVRAHPVFPPAAGCHCS